MTQTIPLIKIMLLGDSGVGKTTLIHQFVDKNFVMQPISTIALDFQNKTMSIENQSYRLQIWDTAGQERFKTITQQYYRSAHGILLLYDVANRQSYYNLEKWKQQIELHASDGVVVFLVGNKSDMNDRRVTYHEGLQLASQSQFMYTEMSAKNNIEATTLFRNLCQAIIANRAQSLTISPNWTLGNQSIMLEEADSTQNRNCC